jgi:general secretion pathway protein I
MKHSPQQGFTLIEVLAALIIVALGMMAVIQAVTQTINNANYLRDKTIAHWVAMNKLTEVRMAAAVPSGGDTAGDVDMAGTTWHWRMTVDGTAVPSMQRIDIQVGPKSAGDKVSIASVTGFFSRVIQVGGSTEWDPTGVPVPGSSSSASSSSSSSSVSSASSSVSSASSASS